MWDLIVSVPDHCLSFYFIVLHTAGTCISFKPGTRTITGERSRCVGADSGVTRGISTTFTYICGK